MASRITCITKPGGLLATHEAITNVGGQQSSGVSFYITRQQCADNIDFGIDTYYVQVGLFQATVTTYKKNGVKYIRISPDGTLVDNLLSLPQCV